MEIKPNLKKSALKHVREDFAEFGPIIDDSLIAFGKKLKDAIKENREYNLQDIELSLSVEDPNLIYFWLGDLGEPIANIEFSELLMAWADEVDDLSECAGFNIPKDVLKKKLNAMASLIKKVENRLCG